MTDNLMEFIISMRWMGKPFCCNGKKTFGLFPQLQSSAKENVGGVLITSQGQQMCSWKGFGLEE